MNKTFIAIAAEQEEALHAIAERCKLALKSGNSIPIVQVSAKAVLEIQHIAEEALK